MQKYFESDSMHKPYKPGACFAARTLVHTKEGLVPIEQIKVGDWVLSKPENGGEQAYKRVVRKIQRESETVMKVLYALPDLTTLYKLIVTPNHPFWIDGQGWTAGANLNETWAETKSVRFELANGGVAYLHGPFPIYVTGEQGVGWTPYHHGDEVRRKGSVWDYINHRLVANGVPAIPQVREGELDDPFLQLAVYNLEVEDFHTYYVGEAGVWVHNHDAPTPTSPSTPQPVSGDRRGRRPPSPPSGSGSPAAAPTHPRASPRPARR